MSAQSSSYPHNVRAVFSDRRRLECWKGSARCLEFGQDNAGGWAEDTGPWATVGHACHLVLCLHWPLHAPTTQARKYVALLFCTDFALSFPRDVCRYICTKDHLMHGFLCVRQQATNMFLDKLLHASPSKYTDYSITDPFTQFRIFAVVKCVYVPSCGCLPVL